MPVSAFSTLNFWANAFARACKLNFYQVLVVQTTNAQTSVLLIVDDILKGRGSSHDLVNLFAKHEEAKPHR